MYLDEEDLERSHELERRFERDAEREPVHRSLRPSRRRQFRYWTGHMFRPARDEGAISS